MSSLWRTLLHSWFGVCDWDGCRCRICRVPRDIGHEWEGCKCRRCPQTRHEWEGCRCPRCGGERHEWQGLICRSCRHRKDLLLLLRDHFPQEEAAAREVLARLEGIDGLDWSTLYDWQVVELCRSVLDCHRQGVDYEIEVDSACLARTMSGVRTEEAATGPSPGYAVPAALRLRRRDNTPVQMFF